jgi:hypothetical protein
LVSFLKQKFFDRNLNQVVIVETPETRYLGILFAAPDSKEDPHIVLSEVSRLPKLGDPSQDIIEIQALTSETLERADVARTKQ